MGLDSPGQNGQERQL